MLKSLRELFNGKNKPPKSPVVPESEVGECRTHQTLGGGGGNPNYMRELGMQGGATGYMKENPIYEGTGHMKENPIYEPTPRGGKSEHVYAELNESLAAAVNSTDGVYSRVGHSDQGRRGSESIYETVPMEPNKFGGSLDANLDKMRKGPTVEDINRLISKLDLSELQKAIIAKQDAFLASKTGGSTTSLVKENVSKVADAIKGGLGGPGITNEQRAALAKQEVYLQQKASKTQTKPTKMKR